MGSCGTSSRLLSHAPHFLPSPRFSHRSAMSVTPDRGSPSVPRVTKTRARMFSRARELGKGPAVYRHRVGWLPSSNTKKKRGVQRLNMAGSKGSLFPPGFPACLVPWDSQPCVCTCRSCCCRFMHSQASVLGLAGSCHPLSIRDQSLFSWGRAELRVMVPSQVWGPQRPEAPLVSRDGEVPIKAPSIPEVHGPRAPGPARGGTCLPLLSSVMVTSVKCK